MAKATWSLSSKAPQGLWKHHTPRKHVLNIVDMYSCQNFKKSSIRQDFRRASWFFWEFPQAHSAALMEHSAAFLDAFIIIFSGTVYHVNVLTLPFSFLYYMVFDGYLLTLNIALSTRDKSKL